MEILPAIDLKRDATGRVRCVRLEQGRADRETEFAGEPAAVAQRWESCGARWIHVVDLDGAFAGRPVNIETTTAIVRSVRAAVEVGGGVRDDATAELLLGPVGAARVVAGTRALAEPRWFRELCGRHPGCVAGGIDARDGRVAVDGWTRDSGIEMTDAARRLAEAGAAVLIVTDIATDCMLSGPNVGAIERVLACVSVPVIASGGVSSLEDVRRLAQFPLEGVIIGMALYSGAVDLREALRIALRAPSA